MYLKIKDDDRVYDGAFGDIVSYKIEYELFSGDRTEATREIAPTKDLIAVFLFDPKRDEVILRERFQLATHEYGRRHGWIRETYGKKIKAQKDVPDEESVQEDFEKQFGMRIDVIGHISTFFSAADRLTQRVFLYYAEGRLDYDEGRDRRDRRDDDRDDDRRDRDRDRHSSRRNDRQDDEEPYFIEVDKFLERLAEGRYEDPKLIIGGLFLQAELRRSGKKNYEGRTSAGWRRRERDDDREDNRRPFDGGRDLRAAADARLVGDDFGGEGERRHEKERGLREDERELRADVNRQLEAERENRSDVNRLLEEERERLEDEERRREQERRPRPDYIPAAAATGSHPGRRWRRVFIGIMALVVIVLLVIAWLILSGN